jgi:hypothetical protein
MNYAHMKEGWRVTFLEADCKTPLPKRLTFASGKFLLLLNAQGLEEDPWLLQSAGYGLDEEAFKALAKWKFSPAIYAGKPVAEHVAIEVFFRIR